MRIKILMKFLFTLISTGLLVGIVAAPAKAANQDFYDKANGVIYYASDYRTDLTIFNALMIALDDEPSNFVFEYNGKGYNYARVLNFLTSNLTTCITSQQAFSIAIADPANEDALPVSH